MLGNDTFYNGLLRKYVTYFGSIFDDITINRVDASGSVQQTMKIPLDYGPKERYLTRQIQNPDLLREVSMVLPRMAFEMTGFAYDPARKLSTTDRLSGTFAGNKNTLSSVFNPVPWNIEFTLTILSRNTEDAARIIEQILPFFTPNWSQELTLIADIGKPLSVPVILNSINPIEMYTGNFESKEFVVWDLRFTMKAYFFGAVSRSNVIKEIIVNSFVPSTNTAAEGFGITPRLVEIDITPGLTANGQPTSNSQLSIPSSQISATDDYGFIVGFAEGF